MEDLNHCEETAVIICGGGPTGALLSALLGQQGVPNVVLEREADITTDPRGIALDEDGIRILQSIGIYDKIFTEIGMCMGTFNFVTGTSHDLYKQPLMALDYSSSEGGTGHIGFICHKQPIMEKAIRGAITQNNFSQLRSSCTLSNILEDSDFVYADYQDASGQQKRIKGRFLVGADGKTGFVRKKYLEPKAITMDVCEGTSYDEVWVALNWRITIPTQETHPDFPLWRLGYSSQQIYDLFFPKEFRFLCNPQRPAICSRFGRPEDQLWRFEFLVHPGEDGKLMAAPEQANKIIFPYLTHTGGRYGLKEDVAFPEDCITTLRSRPFNFSARSCNKWALGRVVLAGDAAHVFPPFGGQGIASGFRDALALAWRLGVFHRYPDADHDRLLRGWYTERKQQFERSLAATIQNGAYVCEANPLKIFVREWWMWFTQLLPSWKREIEKGPRALGMTRYKHQPGLPFLSAMHGGLLLPQVYAQTLAGDKSKVVFSDDLIFRSRDGKLKDALLQLLILPDSIKETGHLIKEAHQVLDKSKTSHISAAETSILIQDTEAHPPNRSLLGSLSTLTARIATADEFAASELCHGRPEPKYYDPYRIRKEVGSDAKYVVLRFDRVVFAACKNADELSVAVDAIPEALHLKE